MVSLVLWLGRVRVLKGFEENYMKVTGSLICIEKLSDFLFLKESVNILLLFSSKLYSNFAIIKALIS